MAARRVSLPAADDLFRPTAPSERGEEEPTEKPVRAVPSEAETSSSRAAKPARRTRTTAAAQPSGRIRHDEKMTVYITSDELLAIEHARLSLRGVHGLVVDRGRLVREAVAMVLAEFEEQGADSALVRRLLEERPEA